MQKRVMNWNQVRVIKAMHELTTGSKEGITFFTVPEISVYANLSDSTCRNALNQLSALILEKRHGSLVNCEKRPRGYLYALNYKYHIRAFLDSNSEIFYYETGGKELIKPDKEE
jgi:hypothetical protein